MTLFNATKSKSLAGALALAVGIAMALPALAQDVTLRGASMFDENHAFTKTMREFARLVEEKPPVLPHLTYA